MPLRLQREPSDHYNSDDATPLDMQKHMQKTSADLKEFQSIMLPGTVINRKLTMALLLFTYWFRAG